MKRLFCLKDQRGKIHANAFYENKMECKKIRDELNKEGVVWHVSRGPDHMGKHGMGRVPYMRRQPR